MFCMLRTTNPPLPNRPSALPFFSNKIPYSSPLPPRSPEKLTHKEEREVMMMTRNVEPLVVGRVIGEVVDMFVPRVTMCVYYGSKHVTNGCDIKPSFAADPPRITFTGSPHHLYTLVMTDPDAPSPSEPSLREWVHWIVTDIPGCTNPTQGKEVVAYLGPKPRLGIHRYVFVLFEQKAPIMGGSGTDHHHHHQLEPLILSSSSSSSTSSRSHFSTRAFAHHFDLGLPVSAVFFNAHKEPLNKRR